MDMQPSNMGTLSQADCLRLLGSVPFGRLVYTSAAMPAVQPVNFIVRGDAVIISTVSGSKLAAARNSVVAFQADEIDAQSRSGWSVTVIGHCNEVVDAAEIADLAKVRPEAWGRPASDRFISIEIERITGRWLHSPAVFVH